MAASIPFSMNSSVLEGEVPIGDLQEPGRHEYFFMKDIFSLFLDKEYGIEPLQVSPSCFTQEMELTSEERHKKLLNPLRRYKYGAEPHLAPRSFKAIPEVLIFQKYVPGQTYSLTLNILNCSEVLKPLQMVFEKSDIFTVTYASTVVMTRLAPGLSVAFDVKFHPTYNRDFTSNITFLSDRETFTVSIIAIGARPLLDFPDHVFLPPTPVRVPATKLLVVRNFGKAPAVFSLTTQRPFSIEPREGIIDCEEVMQLVVTFVHDKMENIEGSLKLKYETGEELFITLHGSSEIADVYFDEESVLFEDTFVGLSREHVITIHNRSKYTLPLKWKRFPSSSIDDAEKERLKEKYICVKEIETLRSTKLETLEIVDFESHDAAYNRIYEDEVKDLENDDFLFQNSVFVIDQLIGEIWPFNSISVLITFKPINPETYYAEAFCEIGGNENRIPISIQGQGRGPYFKLNLDSLDISSIYISSQHSYEVIAVNKGHIPGTIQYVNKEPIFGGRISCEPKSYFLEPEEYKSFVISFSSNRRGNFSEDIIFKILESGENVKLVFKGIVITPTLHFDTKDVHWGEVAVGFPSRQKIVLHNLSIVPVAFSIRMLYDGSEPSLTYKKFSVLTPKPALPDFPQEFSVNPSKGTVPQFSDVTLEVTLLANSPREWETALMVDMWDSKSDSLSLPVFCNAKCASIVCLQEQINIRFCFINCVYNRCITLENRSKIPGFFHIVPQQITDASPMTFSTSVTQGVLKSRGKVEIPLVLMTSTIGKQSIEIYLLVMGLKSPVPCCTITCNGQGPVLSVDPMELDWGETTIIRDSEKELTLINDSPIPATFTCQVISQYKSRVPWTVSPTAGTVVPTGRFKLTVNLYLRDRGHFSGSLEIQLENGKTNTVSMTAKGIGTCIDVEPAIFPELNLGVLYSHCVVMKCLTITNKGLRPYHIIPSHIHTGKQIFSPRDPVFKIIPREINLNVEETLEITVEAKSTKLGDISENIYIFVSGDPKKQKKYVDYQTKISARFIKPVIAFSKPEMVFYANFGVDDEYQLLVDSVEISNLEILPLEVDFQISCPFYIEDETGKLVSTREAYIGSNSTINIIIHFVPQGTDGMNCTLTVRSLKLSFKGHPQQETFPVKGEVNYPNINILPRHINFGCIPVGTMSCQHVILANVSPLPVKFWWYWRLSSFKINELPLVESGVPPIKSKHSKLFIESKNKTDSKIISIEAVPTEGKQIAGVIIGDEVEGEKEKELEGEAKAESELGETPVTDVLFEAIAKKDEKLKKGKGGKQKSKSSKSKSSETKSSESKKSKKSKSAESKSTEPKSPKGKETGKGKDKLKKGKKEKTGEIDEITETETFAETFVETEVEGEKTPYFPTFDEMKGKLFPVVDKYFEPVMDLGIFSILPINSSKRPVIDEVFEITPCYGTLKPHALEYVTVSFSGEKSMSVEVEAICKVEGGPPEQLTIKAMSSNLSYYLDSTSINFGSQVYNEMCQRTITLYNTGYSEFEFMANTVDTTKDSNNTNFILQAGMLIVEPKSGSVPSKSKVELSVCYVPGISGRFKEQFQLEIGYLLPVKITVEGRGVFPQLYVLLPHKPNMTLAPEIGYTAVASLSDWDRPERNTLLSARISSNVSVSYISEMELLDLQANDWEVVSTDEYYPPFYEIDLAIERIIAYKHIEDNPHILLNHTSTAFQQGIPYLVVPPYLLDFGMVIVDTIVRYTGEVYNYGPVPIDVQRLNNPELKKCGIQVQFPRMVGFPVAPHASFQVTFSPKFENFTPTKQEVNCVVVLEVARGAKIPIHIQATVIVPFLKVSTELLEFGQVQCGQCKTLTLILRNEGLVPCKWEAFLVPAKKYVQRKPFTMNSHSVPEDMEPVFTIKHKEDIFNPNMAAIVEVFFQPRKTATYQMNLELSIDQNPEKVVVIVKGEGIEPSLSISNADIKFPPVLPYPQNAEITFFIENSSPFPVEFYFADFDSQIIEEDKILKILAHYYKTDNLLLPVRNPGEKLHKEFYDFYDKLLSNVHTKIDLQLQNYLHELELQREALERLEKEMRKMWGEYGEADSKELLTKGKKQKKKSSHSSSIVKSSVSTPHSAFYSTSGRKIHGKSFSNASSGGRTNHTGSGLHKEMPIVHEDVKEQEKTASRLSSRNGSILQEVPSSLHDILKPSTKERLSSKLSTTKDFHMEGSHSILNPIVSREGSQSIPPTPHSSSKQKMSVAPASPLMFSVLQDILVSLGQDMIDALMKVKCLPSSSLPFGLKSSSLAKSSTISKQSHTLKSSSAQKTLVKSSRPASVSMSATALLQNIIKNLEPQKIQGLIHEHIDELQKDEGFNNEMYDPIQQALISTIAPKLTNDRTDVKDGIFLIFHGAPLTEYTLLAHKAARTLNFLPLNIDQIILESAASAYTVAAMRIRDEINTAFSEFIGKNFPESDEGLEEYGEAAHIPLIDPLEELAKKVNILQTAAEMNRRVDAQAKNGKGKGKEKGVEKGKGKGKAKKVNSASSSALNKIKAGSKGSTKPQLTAVPTLKFPSELLLEILKHRFQMPDCEGGVAIDGLKSNFFNDGTVALTSLLKAIGNVKYIQFIVLFNKFDSYLDDIIRKREQEEERVKLEYEEKIRALQKLSDYQIDTLNEEDLQLYIKLSIDKRKELQKALSERLLKLQEEKSALKERKKKESKKGGKSPSSKPDHSSEDTKMKKSSTTKSKTFKGGEGKKKGGKKSRPTSVKSEKSDKSKKSGESGKSSKSNKSVKSEKSGKSSKGTKSEKSSKTGKSKDSEAKIKNLPISEGTRLELQSQFARFDHEFSTLLSYADTWDKRKGLAVPVLQGTTGAGKKGAKTRPKRPDTATSSSELLTSQSTSGNPDETALAQKEIGIPLWIGDSRNPEASKVESIVEALKQLTDIHEAQPKPLDWSSMMEPDIVLYSYARPIERVIAPHSEIFTLECIKYEEPAIVTEKPETSVITAMNSSLQGKRRKRSSSGVLKELRSKMSSIAAASSSTPIRKNKSKKSSLSIESALTFQSRWILDTGEKVQCKIKCFPQHVGHFSETYEVAVVGRRNNYIISASGVADVPKLDLSPKIMFEHVKETKEEGKIYTCHYFQDRDEFDFGAALHTTKSKENMVRPLNTHFKFKNISEFPVNVSFHFEKPKADHFGYDPSSLTIQPGCSEKLTMWTMPQAVGCLSETLFCCIKNNPEVSQIKLVCQGIKCEFIVDPKTINFENVLLYQKQKQSLLITNKTLVPLLWRFANAQDFKKKFRLSPIDGLLNYNESQRIEIDFIADKVQTINKEPLKLEVFDLDARGDPVFTEVITVSAESYDIMLDVLYAQPDQDHVNFGMVKMGSECSQILQLQNKGNKEFMFRLRVVIPPELSVPAEFQEMVKIDPSAGIVKKECTIEVKCTPMCEVQIKELPLLQCFLFDEKKSDFIFSKIPINLTIESNYSRYTISPSREINFGVMTIGEKKTIDLYVENTGIFDFLFTAMKVGMEAEPFKTPEKVIGKKKSSETKRTAESKKGEKGGKDAKSPKITINVFTIHPSTLVVKPTETAVIHVECKADSEGTYLEEMAISVSESDPADTSKTQVKLLSQSYIPAIDFSDISTIYKEHYTCSYLSEFESPFESSEHCVYATEEGKFMFCRTCVGSSASARIRFQNKCLVPCDIVASIDSNLKASSQQLQPHQAFTVLPTKITVPPYSMEYFTVVFSPVSIQAYSSVLELYVDSSLPSNKQKFFIHLCGEGNIPRITITSPKPEENGISNINFPPTYLGQHSTRQIEFKNKGVIPAKVVLELCMNVGGHFSLYPTEDTIPLMHLWEHDKPIQHTTLVKLYPDQIASIVVDFEPHELGCFKTELKLSVIDNPFENLSAMLFGEAFIEDITIDGVETTEAKTWIQKRGEEPKPPNYHLNYGLCSINTIKRHCFKLTNHSRTHLYRFQWEFHDKVLFTPTVGHIAPKSSKDIIATFLSSEPVKLEKIGLEYTLARIKLREKNNDTAAWDDRQTLVRWETQHICEEYEAESQQYGDEKLCRSSEMSSPDRDKSFKSSDCVVSSKVKSLEMTTPNKEKSSSKDSKALLASVLFKLHREERKDEENYRILPDRDKPLYVQKFLTLSGEPKHHIISGSLRKSVLLVSALADYSKYHCDTQNITFKDTLMFQQSSHEIPLKNVGAVPLKFNCQMILNESYPRRPSTTSLGQIVKTQSKRQFSSSTSTFPSLGKVDRSLSMLTSQHSLHKLQPSAANIDDKSNSPARGHSLNSETKSIGSMRRYCSARCSADLPIQKRLLLSLSDKEYLSDTKRVDKKTVYKTINKPATPISEHYSENSELFSKSAGTSDRTNDTWVEGDYMPFIVFPEFGTLQPEESLNLRITFSPLDVFVYQVKLIINIENLDPEQDELDIQLKGRSFMPYCHFDIEESDYVTSGRRNQALPGPYGLGAGLPLDPETRTLELRVLGVGVTSTRTFGVINPTDEDYGYVWKDVTYYSDRVSSFHCYNVDGVIESGRMVEMKFSFASEDVGIHESFWTFNIPQQNITTPFLLVGIVTEPSVCFLPSHLDFCPLVKGTTAHKTVALVNNEDIPLYFNFKPDSLLASGQSQGLSIEPMSGTVDPNSDKVIHIAFSPVSPGKFDFNVHCAVKRMMKPLNLFISGSCYKVQPMVSCSDLNTKKWTLNPDSSNVLDFGPMIPKQTKTIVFNITNMGQTSFHYGWIYNVDAKKKFNFTVSEKGGLVTAQSRIYCNMSLTFLNKSALQDFEVILRIPFGPEYKVLVQGCATMPQFDFSLSKYDFGPCIVQKSDRCFNKALLKFYNKDSEDISLECSFEETPYLVVRGDFQQPVKAHDNITITICFRPRDENEYEETISFNIAGSLDKNIKILGKGVPLNLKLVNPEDRCLDFGNLQVNQQEVKTIEVVNKSDAPVQAMFGIAEHFPTLDSSFTCVISGQKSETSSSHVLSDMLRIYPSKKTKIAPHQIINLKVKLYPRKRLNPFTEKIYLQVNDYIEPICLLKGSCYGAEFSLNKSYLMFGAVVQDCKTVLTTALLNVGDIGSRFSWHFKSIAHNFTVSPETGYCSPGTSVVIYVEYHPTTTVHRFVHEITCEFENYKPLILTLSGSCVPLPPPKDVIQFTTNVRETRSKNIPIYNRTEDRWTVYPEVTGEYFSGPVILEVPPNGTGQYEVTYSPMSMTRAVRHKGTVLFKLPVGQAELYEMTGIAEPPKASEKRNIEIPTKTTHTELLTVKNWMKIPQRFIVNVESVNGKNEEPLYQLYGNDYITIPGNSERNYNFIIQVYKECNLTFKVIFQNDTDGEFQYYDLFIKVVKRGPIEVLTFSTCVRIPQTRELKLVNPLKTNVNFTITCFSPEVKFPSPITVAANSRVHIPLEYMPLFPGESTCRLDVSCPELGLFPYELNLTALPAPYEKPMHFKTFIGNKCTGEVTSFHNFTPNKADFTTKIDHPDFRVDKTSFSVPGNTRGSVNVTYEPSSLEGVEALLTISSPATGDWLFPLIGTCTVPNPQGPYTLSPEGNLTINFRNPFLETKTFTMYTDNPAFSLKTKSKILDPHKEYPVVVSLSSSMEFIQFPVTGKLVISCSDPAYADIAWVYYIKGVSTVSQRSNSLL